MRSTQIYIVIALALYVTMRAKESYAPLHRLWSGRRGVTVYEDENFGGRSGTFNSGSYSTVKTAKGEFMNKSITSMTVSPGYMVLFYEDDKFKGNRGKLSTGKYPNLGDQWNNRISSLRVKRDIAVAGRRKELDTPGIQRI